MSGAAPSLEFGQVVHYVYNHGRTVDDNAASTAKLTVVLPRTCAQQVPAAILGMQLQMFLGQVCCGGVPARRLLGEGRDVTVAVDVPFVVPVRKKHHSCGTNHCQVF